MDTTVIAADVIIITGPELTWLGVLLASLVVIAATTGYLVVAAAFVRELRRKAVADWTRAHEEWERVREEREESVKAREAKALADWAAAKRLTAEFNEGVTTKCEDPECEFVCNGPHLVSWHEHYAGTTRSAMVPDWDAIHTEAGIDVKEENVECLDVNCPHANFFHTVAHHAKMIKDKEGKKDT